MNCDPKPPRGNPKWFGYEKVSLNGSNQRLKNEVLSLGENLRKQKQFNAKIYNVSKLLKHLAKCTKTRTSKLTRWILNETTKWKNFTQISLSFFIISQLLFKFARINTVLNEIFCENEISNMSNIRIPNITLKIIINLTINIGTVWLKWITITISSSRMLSLTIYLELLKQSVEANPGMVNGRNQATLSILTYNCNGLGDKKKLRRILFIVKVTSFQIIRFHRT